MITTENAAMCSYRVYSKLSIHTHTCIYVRVSMHMLNSLTVVILTMSTHIKISTLNYNFYVFTVQIKLAETLKCNLMVKIKH